MKKITLFNFPFHFYEPIRKTNEMLHLFWYKDQQKDLETHKRTLEELYIQKQNKEAEIEVLEEETRDYKERPEVIKHEKKGEELRQKYPDDYRSQSLESEKAYKQYYEDKPEIFKKIKELQSNKYRLSEFVKQIDKVEKILSNDTDPMPVPINSSHINAINKEIEEKADLGWKFEKYELITTEFFFKETYWQKCYSGVIMTWQVDVDK